MTATPPTPGKYEEVRDAFPLGTRVRVSDDALALDGGATAWRGIVGYVVGYKFASRGRQDHQWVVTVGSVDVLPEYLTILPPEQVPAPAPDLSRDPPARLVIDRDHRVWRVLHEGVTAVTVTDVQGFASGVVTYMKVLEDTLGPLVPFDPAAYVASLPYVPTDCSEHKLVQHRDARPPWCPSCGRMQGGQPHEAYVRTGRGGW